MATKPVVFVKETAGDFVFLNFRFGRFCYGYCAVRIWCRLTIHLIVSRTNKMTLAINSQPDWMSLSLSLAQHGDIEEERGSASNSICAQGPLDPAQSLPDAHHGPLLLVHSSVACALPYSVSKISFYLLSSCLYK